MTILIHIGNKGSTISINEFVHIKEPNTYMQKSCHLNFMSKHLFSILLPLLHLVGFGMQNWSSLNFAVFQK